MTDILGNISHCSLQQDDIRSRERPPTLFHDKLAEYWRVGN